ncbi:MAG: 50S ribosomal protein L25/general stress protein Ctc [Alphaproteobacteria bacterium]|nr:50S ribosomal protein L25/general stress protein Ctc [Alphaproteobacteria bacterium]
MTETATFSAEARTRVGKGAARAARRAGTVPAVVYGANKDPMPITINPIALRTEISKPGFFATLYDIDCDGTKERVLCRDLQLHPVTDVPMHADFLRVTESTQINVDIAVIFENEEESPGLKGGGVLNIVRHTVEVICRAGAIPESIVIDLTGREVGDSIHISEVSLPDGVRPTIDDRDFTIATIAAPTLMPVEEEIEEDLEGLEGEEGEEGVEGEEGAEGEDSGDSEDS